MIWSFQVFLIPYLFSLVFLVVKFINWLLFIIRFLVIFACVYHGEFSIVFVTLFLFCVCVKIEFSVW